jgi:acyl-CoA thioesterase
VTSDLEFLGLTPAAGPPVGRGRARFTLTVTEHLCRLDGRLYGGAAIGASMAGASELTGRPVLWMTTQFVASVSQGATVTVDVEVLAAGHRTAQVRVTGAADDGAVVFASLGATGTHKATGLTGSFDAPPQVAPPEASTPLGNPFARMAAAAGIDLPRPPEPTGFAVAVESRQPEVTHHPDPGAGRECLWLRRRDGGPLTPAVVAYLADLIPSSVARAAGKLGGGTSLDNTFRVGNWAPSDWVLLDMRPHFAVGGYGSGTALIWSETGGLLATASQTASMVLFDPAALTELLRSATDT